MTRVEVRKIRRCAIYRAVLVGRRGAQRQSGGPTRWRIVDPRLRAVLMPVLAVVCRSLLLARRAAQDCQGEEGEPGRGGFLLPEVEGAPGLVHALGPPATHGGLFAR